MKVNHAERVKNMKECPRCQLASPQNATWCDCGYDFATGQIKGGPQVSLDSIRGLKIARLATLTTSGFALVMWGTAFMLNLLSSGGFFSEPYDPSHDLLAKELGLGPLGGWLFGIYNIFFPIAYFIFCFISSWSLVNLRTLGILGVVFHLGLLGLCYLILLLWLLPLLFLAPCAVSWCWMLIERREAEKHRFPPMAVSRSAVG